MRENILVETNIFVRTNTLAQVVKWSDEGATQKQIVDRLKNEYNIKVAQSQISNILKKVRQVMPVIAHIRECEWCPDEYIPEVAED